MRINYKHIDDIGRIIVDAMLLLLLVGIVALPAASMTLVGYNNKNVLSVKDTRPAKNMTLEKVVPENDPTKSVRIIKETTTSGTITTAATVITDSTDDQVNIR